MTEEDTLAFARATIGSLWELELLLLLHRTRDRTWTPDQLKNALHASQAIVGQNLRRLEAKGIAARLDSGEYRYHAAEESAGRAVEALAEFFAIKPFAVMNAIVGAPSDGLQHFSDAFKFKD